LTAEAVAELKQMPLITVSVGELGESAATLEAKLTEILECASLWDAVVLLDEADVFLQARTLHEIQRNAMVGVFLRILEYHQRIMFLTTNRIATFDEAFKSRISVAINYKDLDVNTRRSIWVNFLAMATVKIVDTKLVEDDVAYLTTEQLEKLASKCFNGREIKNAVRTAQALAMSTNKKLNYALLLKVIHIMEEFDQDFATSLYS
jgi:SpoVK/Ycf46/Vps4 family AAA+-type ATPase